MSGVRGEGETALAMYTCSLDAERDCTKWTRNSPEDGGLLNKKNKEEDDGSSRVKRVRTVLLGVMKSPPRCVRWGTPGGCGATIAAMKIILSFVLFPLPLSLSLSSSACVRMFHAGVCASSEPSHIILYFAIIWHWSEAAPGVSK